jgi:AcrR family transcriptional regulator
LSDDGALAPHLRRRPAQARSARRVEAILDAAAELLRDRAPQRLAVRDLAAAAGVPTGTIYQFFDGRDAVLQALALRFLAGFPAVLDRALSQATTWERTVDAVVDAYADLVREHPAIRQLWLSGALDAATQRAERDADRDLAARLGRRLRAQAGTRRGSAAQFEVLVALVAGLLRHAFAEAVEGDPVALREARRAARAYAGAVLGAAPA